MKKIILLFIIFISAGNSFGQQVTFQKKYSTTGFAYGRKVLQTSDGGYIISGYTDLPLSNSYTHIILIKTDAYGDLTWTKTFDGGTLDFGYSLIQTNDGGYMITGATYFGNNRDVILIKTDANGNILWNKTYDYDYESGTSIFPTSDGGYIISSSIQDFSAQGEPYAQLIKTDSIGNLLWSQIYYASEEGGNVYPTGDGGYIFGTTNFSTASSLDVQLIRTDSAGNTLWRKTYGGINEDFGNAWQTADGGYIIGGGTNSFGAGNYDALLIKTDSNGYMLWAKTYGGSNYDNIREVCQTIDGGYIFTGQTNNFGLGFADIFLVKTDANGDTIWTRTFGGTSWDLSFSVQQTADSGYIISGTTGSFGDSALYLIKTDANGNAGCNQASAPMIVSAAPLQQTSSSTGTFSWTSVDSASLVVGSGGPVTTLCTSVGIPSINSNPKSEISISPNPTTNNFTVTFPNTINKGSIEIYDAMGKKIYKENIADVSQKEIVFKNIVGGIYFVKVKDGEKEYCKKLVIE